MPLALSIEERVAALERRVGGDDTAFPTLVKLNPDGTVSFDFDGHIHAQGLDLDEADTDTPDPINKVGWFEQPGNTERSFIAGYRNLGLHYLLLEVYVPTGDVFGPNILIGGDGSILLTCKDGTDLESYQFHPAGLLEFLGGGNTFDFVDGTAAQIQLNSGSAALQLRTDSSLFRLIAIAGAVSRRIFADNGTSHFLQLPGTPANRIVNMGETTIDFGAGANSMSTAVAHGLTDSFGNAVTPVAVVANPEPVAAICQTTGYGGTNFTLRIQNRDAATNLVGNITAHWIAIG